ncbi:hypothetical protein WJX72_005083 [[Myrmecia] bisecta]|uniref:tRNA (uracil(54)-C(5))-methyltransferase n=1 Tax=[Myrmecia] bisecta TaxID=41462 RepID=A0AAW1QFL5_9CHLO
MDADHYERQLTAKVQRVQELFQNFTMPDIEVFRSEPKHYRMRSEFRVWHEGDETYYIMFEPGEGDKQKQVRVDQFPPGSQLMNVLMRLVMQEVAKDPVLRTKLYVVSFLTTLSGQSLVSLIYKKKLGEDWVASAQQLRAVLAAAPENPAGATTLLGRSRKQKIELDCSHVVERLTVDGRQFVYKQIEGAFSQPNAGVCQHMLAWARDVTRKSSADLLELYCGNGNFTVALADNFRMAVATEVNKTSVAAAKENLDANNISNVFVGRVSSEEFTEAWKGVRQFTRLQDLDLASCKLQTILVDPPRAGLDAQTVKLLHEFQNVVYISCNPDTLHANLCNIADSHEIKRFAVFDQFPWTHHVECGAYLQRRQK